MAENKIGRKIKKSENYKFTVNDHYVEKYWGKWRCFAVNKYIKVLIVLTNSKFMNILLNVWKIKDNINKDENVYYNNIKSGNWEGI